MLEQKKFRGDMLMALNIDAKFEGKLTCAFKSNMKISVNFYQSTFENLKIGTFIWSFQPKQKKDELKIHRGVKCHENEE